MASPERDFETLAQAPAFARRYALGRLLGRGAMGVVYAGAHVAMRRPVAIKFLLKLGNREGQQRFLREARLMAEVQHPHVAQVFDFDELDGVPFLVTEFLDGGTLRDMLEGGQPKPIPVGIKVLDGPKKWASLVLDQARAQPERHGHALDERTCRLKA